ncbi:MAG: glycosyltransferase family 2 protein [Alphaproteobacteria bacterium]
MPLEVRSLAEWEAAGVAGMLSVVIPAHNEEGHIEETVRGLVTALSAAGITHEILVVDDNSRDATAAILHRLAAELPTLRVAQNAAPNGFGLAVRTGLAAFRGDAVAIVMADGSDAPEDLVAFHQALRDGYDCVFGTRFGRGGRARGYPWPKWLLNRLGNGLIRALFLIRYNDVTNAFKLYRRSVIAGIQPLLSHHFNLTVELPLKAIVRGYRYAVLPNGWVNRKEGLSKFRIREMGSRYLFIILYCLLEKLLSRQDYRDRDDLRRDQLQVWPR